MKSVIDLLLDYLEIVLTILNFEIAIIQTYRMDIVSNIYESMLYTFYMNRLSIF